MAELKPRLIITSRGRKRRGFGTLLIVLIIFAAGFYAGYKYGGYFFGTSTPGSIAKKEVIDRTDNGEDVSLKEESLGQENRTRTPV